MKIIIDTHIFLWALAARSKLDEKRLQLLQSKANIIYVSSISIAELMIKTSLGKMDINFDPMKIALDSGFELLDYSAPPALILRDLPFHRDPFDRMLISQAIYHNHPLMTDDSAIRKYDCRII